MANKKRRKQNRHRNTQARSTTATTTAERPASDRTKTAPPASPGARRAKPGGRSPASSARAERKEMARQEREAVRKKIARAERTRRLAWILGIAAVVGVGVFLFLRPDEAERPSGPLPGELTTEAPWPANGNEAQARAEAIGLPPESPVVMHEHSNLQIFVHGEPQPIPTDVGIDTSDDPAYVASLHTHDDTGTVHMESSVSRTFTVGEFFDIWGVRLSPSCMGAYCQDAENRLQVFVDGEEVTENVRDVALDDQRVIVITYGTEDELPDPIPSEFDFSSIAP
jgi:hypothetical protein